MLASLGEEEPEDNADKWHKSSSHEKLKDAMGILFQFERSIDHQGDMLKEFTMKFAVDFAFEKAKGCI